MGDSDAKTQVDLSCVDHRRCDSFETASRVNSKTADQSGRGLDGEKLDAGKRDYFCDQNE